MSSLTTPPLGLATPSLSGPDSSTPSDEHYSSVSAAAAPARTGLAPLASQFLGVLPNQPMRAEDLFADAARLTLSSNALNNRRRRP